MQSPFMCRNETDISGLDRERERYLVAVFAWIWFRAWGGLRLWGRATLLFISFAGWRSCFLCWRPLWKKNPTICLTWYLPVLAILVILRQQVTIFRRCLIINTNKVSLHCSQTGLKKIFTPLVGKKLQRWYTLEWKSIFVCTIIKAICFWGTPDSAIKHRR